MNQDDPLHVEAPTRTAAREAARPRRPGGAERIPNAAMLALKQGRKIEAIAITRQELGLNLLEAKRRVDANASLHSAPASSESGSLPIALLALLALGMGIWLLFVGA